MCFSLAVLRRCRTSTTKLPKARAVVSAKGKDELIEQQYGVQQQQTIAGGGGEGDVQDGKKRAPEESPPPRTQLAPHHRYQPATDAEVAAGKFPCPETSAKRRLRALAPLPNRVAPLEQVLSPPIAPSLPACLPPAPSSPAFFSPSDSGLEKSWGMSSTGASMKCVCVCVCVWWWWWGAGGGGRG